MSCLHYADNGCSSPAIFIVSKMSGLVQFPGTEKACVALMQKPGKCFIPFICTLEKSKEVYNKSKWVNFICRRCSQIEKQNWLFLCPRIIIEPYHYLEISVFP